MLLLFFDAVKHFSLIYPAFFFLLYASVFLVYILFFIPSVGFWFSFFFKFFSLVGAFIFWRDVFCLYFPPSFLPPVSGTFKIMNCMLLIDSICCSLPRCKHKGPQVVGLDFPAVNMFCPSHPQQCFVSYTKFGASYSPR